MARKKKHEEHQNHEAWAIPYGDLVTLLFALFTVMYAVSSVNEGKFRVLSDAIIAAFNGAPTSVHPINIGERDPGKGGDQALVGITPKVLIKLNESNTARKDAAPAQPSGAKPGAPEAAGTGAALTRMQRDVQDAMQALIDAKLVTVRRADLWLEIEINADVLFPSGAGEFSPDAEPVLDKLAQVLKPFTNPIRVEGHTDDRPIKTEAFPSNWELSAARAASVVHQFTRQGIDPLRLEIVGFGEFHPRAPNDTVEGRNANRRVVILVMEQVAQEAAAAQPAQAPQSAAPVQASQSGASAQPAQASHSAAPVQASQSGASPQPAQVSHSAAPVQPAQSANPAQPQQPTQE